MGRTCEGDLTPQEIKAIRSLQRSAKLWPSSLMIAVLPGSDQLTIFKLDENNNIPMTKYDEFQPDIDAAVASIDLNVRDYG